MSGCIVLIGPATSPKVCQILTVIWASHLTRLPHVTHTPTSPFLALSPPFPRPFPAFPRLSRFPYVACEVLCTEVGLVLDQVINAHMVAVFSILDTSEAINPRLAGYFDKVSKRVVSWTITTHVCSSLCRFIRLEHF